eukprot:11171122-Heterocapsa_arctica.AAC.1
MLPQEDQFLEPRNDTEADLTDDELSVDDRLTGDRPIKSAAGFYSPSLDHKPNLQADIPPGDARWGRRLRERSS